MIGSSLDLTNIPKWWFQSQKEPVGESEVPSTYGKWQKMLPFKIGMEREEQVVAEKYGKWAWIAFRCDRRGYYQSESLAVTIMEVLNKLYGTNKAGCPLNIDALGEYYGHFYGSMIHGVAVDGSRCIACLKSKSCRECLFGKQYGKCGEVGSLFGTFLSTLSMEAEGRFFDRSYKEGKYAIVR